MYVEVSILDYVIKIPQPRRQFTAFVLAAGLLVGMINGKPQSIFFAFFFLLLLLLSFF